MIRKMTIAGLATLGLAASLLTPSAAYAADEYSMDVVSQQGNGCSQTVNAPTYDANNKSFNLVYNDFKVTAGQSKFCQLTLQVHVPAGISFAFYQMTNRGMGYLQGTDRARLTTSAYYVTPPPNTFYSVKNFQWLGHGDGFSVPWQHTVYAADGWEWSRCGESKKLLVKNNMQVTGGSNASMELQDTDMSVSTYFFFRFQPC